MDIYCDSLRIHVIDKNRRPEFDRIMDEFFTNVLLNENNIFVIMQFNAGRKAFIRLTLRLFSSAMTPFYLIEHEMTGFKVFMITSVVSHYAADLIVGKRVLDYRQIHTLAINVERMIRKKWNVDDVWRTEKFIESINARNLKYQQNNSFML